MKTLLNILSVLMLFGVSTFLGFFDKATEMGLAIVAGALGLAFANIDKIHKFKGAGFEAEMKDLVKEGHDVIDSLKELGIALSKPIMLYMAIGDRMASPKDSFKVSTRNQVVSTLEKLKATEDEINGVTGSLDHIIECDLAHVVISRIQASSTIQLSEKENDEIKRIYPKLDKEFEKDFDAVISKYTKVDEDVNKSYTLLKKYQNERVLEDGQD